MVCFRRGKKQISSRYIDVIEDMYDGAIMRVRTIDEETESFLSPQAYTKSSLSPCLLA